MISFYKSWTAMKNMVGQIRNFTAAPIMQSQLNLGQHPITGKDRLVSYCKLPPKSTTAGLPGLIFVPGFLSHKSGTKPLMLEQYAQERGCAYVRYDPEGLGDSSTSLEHLCFSHWVEDMEAILDHVTTGPQILIGSSMGAWISLLVAPRKPGRIHSLVFISPVINFIYPFYKMIYETLSDETKSIVDGGKLYMADTVYGPIPIIKGMSEASREYHLDTNKILETNYPIRILHGMKDERCTVKDVMSLVQLVNSNDVEVMSRKAGEHRLSEKEDMENLKLVLDRLMTPSKL